MNVKWELRDDFRSPDVPPVKQIPGISRVSSRGSKEILMSQTLVRNVKIPKSAIKIKGSEFSHHMGSIASVPQ